MVAAASVANLLTPELAVGLGAGRVRVQRGCVAVLPGAKLLASRQADLNPGLLNAAVGIGLPLHIGTLALQLGPRMDLLLVAVLFSAEETGWYSLAVILADAVFLVCRVLAELALPVQTTETAAAAIIGTRRITAMSLKLGLSIRPARCHSLASTPAAALGSEWSGAVPPLVALIAAAGAVAIINPVRMLLVRLYDPRRLGAIAFGTLAGNLLVTLALSQVLGLVGAALASTLVFWIYALVLVRSQ